MARNIHHELVVGLEHQFYLPINIGLLIIPIDFHIFQRGKPTTNQWKMLDFPSSKAPWISILGQSFWASGRERFCGFHILHAALPQGCALKNNVGVWVKTFEPWWTWHSEDLAASRVWLPSHTLSFVRYIFDCIPLHFPVSAFKSAWNPDNSTMSHKAKPPSVLLVGLWNYSILMSTSSRDE